MRSLLGFMLLSASVLGNALANFPDDKVYAESGTPVVTSFEEQNDVETDDYAYQDTKKVEGHRPKRTTLDYLGKSVMDMLGINPKQEEPWKGKWFPHSPTENSPKADLPENMKDEKHGVVMGVSNDHCDNGTWNLEKDWDGSPVDYTCYHPNKPFEVDLSLEPISECSDIPKSYTPQHICMNETIVYNTSLPTHEGHRPLWPVFGEYVYVPPQRWLHNIEHGAIVFLYHPCAHPLEVQLTRKMIKSCVWKYIISPSTLLDRKRPLALVAWGCRLQMAYFDPIVVRNFIRHKALRGLEGKYRRNGQYDFGLLEASEMPGYLQQLDVEEPERDGIVDKVHC